MLVRSAQGLYWMSRYVERARRLCRLLQLQTESLVDRPIREIHFGWSRIYESVNRQPPAGKIELLGGDDYTLADSYTLAGDLTFERSNPSSVWCCFDRGRDNARQIRQSISTPDVDPSQPGVSATPAAGAAGNDGRSRPRVSMPKRWRRLTPSWVWLRPRCTVAKAGASCSWGGLSSAPNSWLRCSWRNSMPKNMWRSLQTRTGPACCACATRLRSTTDALAVAVDARYVLDLLVTDPLLPDSLCRSLDRAAEEIAAIGPGPDARSSEAARRLAGRLGAIIHYQWPDQQDRHTLLEQVRVHCYELHDRVTAAYFDYPVEDAPLR